MNETDAIMKTLAAMPGSIIGNASKPMDSDYCFGKDACENWTERFLDANLKLHTIKLEDWSEVVPTKKGNICMQPCVTADGELGLAFSIGEVRPLGYVTYVDQKLVKNFIYISTDRDYLLRLYNNDQHVGDICNHSVEELGSVHFPIQDYSVLAPSGSDFDFTKLSNGDIRELVHQAEQHNEEYQRILRECDAADRDNPTAEEKKKFFELQDKAEYLGANMPLEATHSGYKVVCASLKHYDGEAINLPSEYAIGTDTFEQAVYAAYPELKELIDEIEQRKLFITQALYALCKPGYDGEHNGFGSPAAVTKDTFMNTASWLMPLMEKSIDPEKWFDEHFPNGASDGDEVTEAVHNATK